MPCGCFGGSKKSKGKVKVPLELDQNALTTEGQNDPNRTAKRRDVVASHYGDECALLGYKTTASRPCSQVDSPETRTELLNTQSRNSSLNSSSSRLQGALYRSQLAEKRREFFRDFATPDYRSSHSLSSTLPSRPKPIFGKPLRDATSRPLSQPCDDDYSPLPPGPHLLHPSPSDPPEDPILDAETLASKEFLLELKSASDEISRRWAMSEDEKENYPSTLKMKTIIPIYSEDFKEINGNQKEAVFDPLSISLSQEPIVSSMHEEMTNRAMNDNSDTTDVKLKNVIDVESTENRNILISNLSSSDNISSEDIDCRSDPDTFIAESSQLKNISSEGNIAAATTSMTERVISEPELTFDESEVLITESGTEAMEQEPATSASVNSPNFIVMEPKLEDEETIISPIEDDDFPTSYDLDDTSQAALSQLLEDQSNMNDINVNDDEQADIYLKESTIITNPFVQEDEQEELITPHDSRLQLIMEENVVEEDNESSSSLSSNEEDQSSSPNEMKQCEDVSQNIVEESNQALYDDQMNKINDQIGHELSDESSRNDDGNLKVVDEAAKQEDISSAAEPQILSSAMSGPQKIGVAEAVHDDGLGSEIEEGPESLDYPSASEITSEKSSK